MKNTRQKICTTIRDLKQYLVDLLSVRAQKIKSTQDQFYTYIKKMMKFTKNTRQNTSIYFYNH